MLDDVNEHQSSERFVPESDATAINALLREMVTQSIVPFMENRVMTWNEQVASRRRGISGRFMSLSKRWTGFGSVKNTTSGSGQANNPSPSNFDPQRGFYPPDTPEVTMRQLGDYSFMLRDWKLASSTYEFLRSEFNHDNVWNYYAAASEMAAISSLLVLHPVNSRSRTENIVQMLDSAMYSYLTRCSMPANVIRCLTLASELFKDHSHVSIDEAARLRGKLLESAVLAPFAQALTTERLADDYASHTKASIPFPSSRRRQAAFWNILASNAWLRIGGYTQARGRLNLAKQHYDCGEGPIGKLPFASMQSFWQYLDDTLRYSGAAGASTPLVDFGNDKLAKSRPVEETVRLDVLTGPVIVSTFDAEGFTS